MRAGEVDFGTALLKGLAPDGGLFMPSRIPVLSRERMDSLAGETTYADVAFHIISEFLGEDIDNDILHEMCRDAYNFDIPLLKINTNLYLLKLDQGPTASFKDFAARLMARLMSHYSGKLRRRLTILTATSGDTGSAVASAFHKVAGIDVIILFPAEEVSVIQRKQMTSFGENIRTIEVDGKFDDCQRFVKQAFNDSDLDHLNLTSANSINIGRLLPQSVYYIYSWLKTVYNSGNKVIFSVPSGNYGNLMGGLIAMKMGMNTNRFIIATNMNNEVPDYLKSGKYKPIVPSVNCISNAMNVGNPSNLARIIELYGGNMNEAGEIVKKPDIEKMRRDLWGCCVTDKETIETMRNFYDNYGYVIEPHGAVAWKALESYLAILPENISNGDAYISLETAHPGKFGETVKIATGVDPELPASIKEAANKKESFDSIANNYEEFKKYLMND